MIPLFNMFMLLVGVVAGQQVASTPWAGVPLEMLPELSVGEPTLNLLESGWQAPIEGGGFVRVTLYTTELEAREAFQMQRMMATSAPLSVYEGVARDRTDDRVEDRVEAVGDGAGLLLLRDGNIILLVRDPQDEASAVVERLRAALQTDGVTRVWQQRELDGVQIWWDGFGCRREGPPPTVE